MRDNGDKVLVHCHAGCTPQAVCDAANVTLADLFNGAKPQRNGKLGPELAAYNYTDENGTLLLQAVRYEHKEFRQRTPDGKGGWTWKLGDVRRVLYRLPETIQAVQDGFPVVVAEGEKDCDALAKLGFSATCNLGGAGKWRPEHSETLRGAQVYVVADKDATGRQHAQAVAASLHGVASLVAVLELPDYAGRTVKDAADYIGAGGTAGELAELFDTAPEWKPQAAQLAIGTKAVPVEAAAPVSIGERLAAIRFNIHAPPPQEVTIFQTSAGATIATRGNIGAITAQAKAGKSAFVTAIIAAGITPRPDDCDLLGVRAVNPEALPILLLDTEHSPFHHHALCDRILRRAMLTESDQLHAYQLAGFALPELHAALEHLVAERKWLAVVLDGTGDFVADVNDSAECNSFVARLHGLAITHDTHILNILHLNPGSDFKSRGHLGSQLERKAETNLRIEKTDGVSVVFADRNRGADIPKSKGPRFQWSTERAMHTSVATIATGKQEAKTAELREQAAEAYRIAETEALHWKDLVAALLRVPGVRSDRSAERIVSDLKNRNLIVKNIIGQWEQTP